MHLNSGEEGVSRGTKTCKCSEMSIWCLQKSSLLSTVNESGNEQGQNQEKPVGNKFTFELSVMLDSCILSTWEVEDHELMASMGYIARPWLKKLMNK